MVSKIDRYGDKNDDRYQNRYRLKWVLMQVDIAIMKIGVKIDTTIGKAIGTIFLPTINLFTKNFLFEKSKTAERKATIKYQACSRKINS